MGRNCRRFFEFPTFLSSVFSTSPRVVDFISEMEVGSAPSKFCRAFSVVEREDGEVVVVVVVVVDPVVVVAKKPSAAS